MIRNTCRAAAVAVMLLALTGCEAPQETPSDAEQVYRDACLSCHGRAGGSAPDLTTLSAVNGGSFPMDQVIDIIDGREEVRAHDSDMPLWGARYSEAEIMDLAAYLATIQQ